MSFPEVIIRGRRGAFLAALGASAVVAAFAIGTADASLTRPGVHAGTRDQPPLAHTGGFGEPTCYACHFDGELNDTTGSVGIEGLPARYTAGARYRLVVTVRRPELKLAGFELASRFATGADSGTQAGVLIATDDRAAVTPDDASRIQYAHHLRSGTTPLSVGVGRWVVEWIAPTTGSGAVVIHVAGNAANDDDSPLGDYIFARSVTVPTGEK